ncbi:putative phage tail protein [Weissella tructae]
MAELIRLKELMPDYYTNVLEMNKLLEVEQIVLDDFLRNVELQQKNQFVMTADESGVQLWETVVGVDTDPSLDLETRRYNVLARLMPPKPVTKRYMKELLQLLNINAKLIMHVNEFHVDVKMETTDQQATLRLKSLLEGLLPANLTFTSMNIGTDVQSGTATVGMGTLVSTGYTITGKEN